MSDANAPQSSAPPPDLLPELQARIEQATRRLDLLERRISAWETQLEALEKGAGEAAPAGPTVEVVHRFDDLEARIRRLERRSMQARAREAVRGAGDPGAADGSTALGPAEIDPDARAVVFARWNPLQASAGERVQLTVTVDGFDEGAPVEFIISELGGETLPALTVPVGANDEVTASWTPPAPAKGGHREFTFIARCKDRDAHAPVLVVRG